MSYAESFGPNCTSIFVLRVLACGTSDCRSTDSFELASAN